MCVCVCVCVSVCVCYRQVTVTARHEPNSTRSCKSTHMNTHLHLLIRACVCVCMCVLQAGGVGSARYEPHNTKKGKSTPMNTHGHMSTRVCACVYVCVCVLQTSNSHSVCHELHFVCTCNELHCVCAFHELHCVCACLCVSVHVCEHMCVCYRQVTVIVRVTNRTRQGVARLSLRLALGSGVGVCNAVSEASAFLHSLAAGTFHHVNESLHIQEWCVCLCVCLCLCVCVYYGV